MLPCILQLIALAKDQVERCEECDIEADIWNSELSEAKRAALIQELCSEVPTLKLLYTTPESLQKDRLLDSLKVRSIGCVHG